MNLTVVYYTSNREKPEFEKRIMRNLRRTIKPLLIPLVSVSQKPINFGTNICVGDVGLSAQNAWRQFQIGAIEAKTKFVCSGEHDVLYAPDFFTFEPPREDAFYIAHPMYVLWNLRGKKRVFGLKAQGSESAVIIGREYLIAKIEQMLEGHGKWRRELERHGSIPLLFKDANLEHFETKVPSVTFKTDQNIHRKTRFRRGSTTRDIPYWGNAIDLIGKYCG